MKALKFLLTLLVVITFFAFNSSAQKNVKTSDYYGPYELVNVQLPGLPETVTGSFGYYWTVWKSKAQQRAKGYYVGDVTGTKYYTSNVVNYKVIEWIPGAVYGGVQNIYIVDEYGKVYYSFHHNDHLTINANGEISADVMNEHEYMF